MGRYRKKPVVIEARQFTKVNGHELADWCGGLYDDIACALIIPTLEGNLTGTLGDWIIKGVAGEFYPCKPDIFAATYEPA
jgi:hypothetical protein